jgi:putative protein-disulfide isomerase
MVKTARELLDVRPHGGGMTTDAQRQALTPQLRAHVKQHDEQIAQLTGQHFVQVVFQDWLRSQLALPTDNADNCALASEVIGCAN